MNFGHTKILETWQGFFFFCHTMVNGVALCCTRWQLTNISTSFFFCSKCLNFNFTKMPHFTKLNLSRARGTPMWAVICVLLSQAVNGPSWRPCHYLWRGWTSLVAAIMESWCGSDWDGEEQERSKSWYLDKREHHSSPCTTHSRLQYGMVGVVPHGSFFFFPFILFKPSRASIIVSTIVEY